MKKQLLTFIVSFAFLPTLCANRAIQMREVDFTTSVIELHNFGTTSQSLNGWRFCSHDDNQTRRYSSSGGLNGLTIGAGESLFIHFLNNAPAGDDTAINISGRGNFATPLDRGPYAIQLYFQTSFGVGANIADHLQWSIDGVDNINADERSDEAEDGGVWTDQSLWIATTAESEKVTLTDTTGSILHSPSNYQTTEPVAFPTTLTVEAPTIALNGDVTLTWEDLSEFGAINYTVEVSTDLTEENWQPTLDSPLTTNSITISRIIVDSLFFRVTAQLAPQ
ncbi:MAG: hypothetical protein ACSHYB_10850 [Roseibacillus sp.]